MAVHAAKKKKSKYLHGKVETVEVVVHALGKEFSATEGEGRALKDTGYKDTTKVCMSLLEKHTRDFVRHIKGERIIPIKVKFDKFDIDTEKRLGKCVVDRLWDGFYLRSLQVQLGQEGILVKVLKVGSSACLLFFLEKKDRDIFLRRQTLACFESGFWMFVRGRS